MRGLTFAAVAASLSLGCTRFDSDPASSSSGGSSSSSGTIVGAPPTLSEAKLAAFARAQCEVQARCNKWGFLEAYGDVPTCAARVVIRVRDELLAPDVQLTDDMLGTCATSLGAASCDDLVSPVKGCTFVGSRPDGAACGSYAQCTSGTCKKTSTSARCGVCATLPGEGASCADGRCAPGLLCVGGSCVRLAREGESCTGVWCMPSLACALPGSKCVRAGLPGAACALGNYCSTPLGSVCNLALGTCSELATASVGGECGYDDPVTQITACVRAHCMTSGPGSTCEAYKEDGAACVDDRQCQPPFACVNASTSNGKCAFRSGADCK